MSDKSLIEPLGFYVLIEMIKIEEKSEGGIVLQSNDVKREQDGCDIGYVRAFGNTAFAAFPGCDGSTYPPGHKFHTLEPHQIWGIEIGDKVEYNRYEGKLSGVKGVKNMRYIPDTRIIGKVN